MRIFISYGRGDAAEFAQKVARWLKAEGFTPWLDVDEGIPFGSPFDIRIELGIEGSDMLIALLSPWSLRPEGFCRNELLFAQARKRPIIPVRIADVTPPIQIISLNYLDACSNPEAVFAELRTVIQQVAGGGKMALRDWPALKAGRPWWADPRQLSFQEELARHGDSFTGREWLFEQIREWIARPDSRLLLVTAEAGFGKSAVAAQLTARLNVCSVHFCSRSQVESCRPAAWLAALVCQLAVQFPAYRDCLDATPPDWNAPGESLFRTLVADPLHGLGGKLGVSEPWVFVVDALDEAVAEAGRALADLLADSAERVPDWLRIIVTSRPDLNIIAQFNKNQIRCKHLDAEGAPNLADVNRYITDRVTRLEHSGAIDRRFDTSPKLAELSHGNFLFARLTLDSLTDLDENSRLSLDEVGALPAKLGGLYHAMFRKRFRDRDAYESEILPLLDCLVAARGPVPREFLRATAGLDLRNFQRGFRALSQFLNSDGMGCGVFHQSLADWLVGEEASGEFAASQRDGREKLTAACWTGYQKGPFEMPAYALLHIVTHLTDLGRWDDACQILCDLRFIEARCVAGQVFELLADYRLTLDSLPEAQPELLKQKLEGAHLVRWMTGILEYSQQWSNRTDREAQGEASSEPEPLLPSPPPICEISSEDKIQGEWERILQRPTRRDRLEAFAGFVGGQCYPLLENGKSLGFVRRHAFNTEPTGLVHENATLFLDTLSGPQLLRRWPHEARRNSKPSLLRTLSGHQHHVRGVGVTPDGRVAVSASADKTVRLWNPASGQCLRTLSGHSQYVSAVSITPDGGRAVSGSWDNTVRSWDLASGQCRSELIGHKDWVSSVSLTPDGRWVVSGSGDGTIRLWDLASGQCVRVMTGHLDQVWSVSVTPDGRRAVSGSDDRTVKVWDLTTGQCLQTFKGHSRYVTCVSITPDARWAISGSNDQTLRVWDLAVGQCVRTLMGHTREVIGLSMTPDGRRAVSGSNDRTARVWDLVSGQCLRILTGHSDAVLGVCVTPDGRWMISAGSDRTVRVWDLANGQTLFPVNEHSAAVESVSVTQDGQQAVSGSADKTLRLWDLTNGRCLQTLEGHNARVSTVTVIPNENYVVSGSYDWTLRVWDLASGQCIQTLSGHSDEVTSAGVTPDGRQVVSASADKAVRVWDLRTGRCLRCLEGHSQRIQSVTVTPDGRSAISGSLDKTLRVWDLTSGQCVRTLTGHKDEVTSVDVTPDGQWAVSASGDNTLRTWNLIDGHCLLTLAGHCAGVTSVSVAPSGRWAVSGSWDNTLRVWDLKTGQCLAVYPGAAPFRSAAFSRQGNVICAGTTTGEVLFLEFDPDQTAPTILATANSH